MLIVNLLYSIGTKERLFYKYVRDIDKQIIFQKLTVVHKLPFISLIFIKKEPTHFSIKGKSRKKHKFVNLCYVYSTECVHQELTELSSICKILQISYNLCQICCKKILRKIGLSNQTFAC